MSKSKGPYVPDADQVIGGPKAGVALTPSPWVMSLIIDTSEVAHVEAPESKII